MAIEQTSINMSGKWELAAPLPMNKFKGEVEAFAADSTMGLAKKEQKKIDLKCPFYYYNGAGTETAHIVAGVKDCAAYIDAMAQFTADTTLTQYLTGEAADGEVARDETEAVWTYSFSCQLGSDTFQMIFHKDNLVIQNYSNSTTKTVLETYLETRPNLVQP